MAAGSFFHGRCEGLSRNAPGVAHARISLATGAKSAWKWTVLVLLAQNGLVNDLLQRLGLIDTPLPRASHILGAGARHTFLHVVLPLIRPGIVAGAVFVAVTSFGEVSLSLFLTAPGTITMPVRIFTYIDETFDPVVYAVSAIFILLAVLALVLVERTIGLTKSL